MEDVKQEILDQKYKEAGDKFLFNLRDTVHFADLSALWFERTKGMQISDKVRLGTSLGIGPYGEYTPTATIELAKMQVGLVNSVDTPSKLKDEGMELNKSTCEFEKVVSEAWHTYAEGRAREEGPSLKAPTVDEFKEGFLAGSYDEMFKTVHKQFAEQEYQLLGQETIMDLHYQHYIQGQYDRFLKDEDPVQ